MCQNVETMREFTAFPRDFGVLQSGIRKGDDGPMFWPPMLAEKRDDPFDDERYMFEPKIDGHRLILSMHNGIVQLYTRRGIDVTRQYPELHRVPIADNSDVVLDGEVACFNRETGKFDFELVMERYQARGPLNIQMGSVGNPAHYFVFDMMRYKGEDLRARPLAERKALLEKVLTDNAHFSRLLTVDGTGIALFRAIRAKNLEGIVAKRKDSVYTRGRSDSWLSIINYRTAVVEIAGYRKNQFGWLARHNGRTVGLIELPVPPAYRQAFYGVARAIVTGEDWDYVYVEPRIRAQVRFRSWSRSGLMREPEFVDFVV